MSLTLLMERLFTLLTLRLQQIPTVRLRLQRRLLYRPLPLLVLQRPCRLQRPYRLRLVKALQLPLRRASRRVNHRALLYLLRLLYRLRLVKALQLPLRRASLHLHQLRKARVNRPQCLPVPARRPRPLLAHPPVYLPVLLKAPQPALQLLRVCLVAHPPVYLPVLLSLQAPLFPLRHLLRRVSQRVNHLLPQRVHQKVLVPLPPNLPVLHLQLVNPPPPPHPLQPVSQRVFLLRLHLPPPLQPVSQRVKALPPPPPPVLAPPPPPVHQLVKASQPPPPPPPLSVLAPPHLRLHLHLLPPPLRPQRTRQNILQKTLFIPINTSPPGDNKIAFSQCRVLILGHGSIQK